MEQSNFTTSILVDKSVEQVFNAVTNVRGWWSEEIEGGTSQLNDVFYYHFEDVHRCTIKLIEVVPSQKVVWHILENYFKFTENEKEWTDTKVYFNISKEGNRVKVKMTHEGLVPDYECYEICQGAWTTYIQKSLKSLIETGKGMPNAKGRPQTENEKRLMEK